GDCFVAVPGFKQDARRFVPDAITRGAALVVTEGEPLAGLSVAQVLVPAVRPALARLAGAYHGHPSRALTVVGITGTNGKTTTSYLVDALLRVDGLAFDVAVFTNLTQDHLDFHGTFEEYRRAKRLLFEQLAASPKPHPTAVINDDDPSGAEMVRNLAVSALTFGLGRGANV